MRFENRKCGSAFYKQRMGLERCNYYLREESLEYFYAKKRSSSFSGLLLNLYIYLVLVRLHALNSAVCVVLNLAEHYATLMVYTTGKGRVVVEQVPLVVPLYDGVVGGPTDNRL